MRSLRFILATAVVGAVCIAFAGFAAEPAAELPAWAKGLGVEPWHRAGVRGKSITVAVLDTGFRGYRRAIGNALPAHVIAKSLRVDGNLESRDSEHGVLCGEIVHALAPETRVILVDWQPGDPASFVEAIAWAKKAGAKIITCSVILPCWSDGEGGGPTHAALNQVIGSGKQADDLICVACAGNVAKRHWSGHVSPGKDGWHRWPDGTIDNSVTAFGDNPLSVELTSQAGKFEVLVVDDAGREVGRQTGEGSVVVRFVPRSTRRFAVRVRVLDARAESFHLVTLAAWLGQTTAQGSIPFPGDGPRWLTVGAWEGEARAEYSSCGPNSPAPKPDLVARVPIASRLRAEPFGGTSAAAPQAAGLAALIWSKNPQFTADEVKERLRRSARDVLAPGYDAESGWGVLQLPRVIEGSR